MRRRGQRACRRETTKLGLTGRQSQSPAPRTDGTDRGGSSPESVWGSSRAQRGRLKGNRHLLKMNERHRHTVSRTIYSGFSFERSKTVIISCCSLSMDDGGEKNNPFVVTFCYGQAVMSVCRNVCGDNTHPDRFCADFGEKKEEKKKEEGCQALVLHPTCSEMALRRRSLVRNAGFLSPPLTSPYLNAAQNWLFGFTREGKLRFFQQPEKGLCCPVDLCERVCVYVCMYECWS